MDSETNRFYKTEAFGIIPATNRASLLQIKERLVCLNIKLNLNALSIPGIRQSYRQNKIAPSVNFFGETIRQLIKEGVPNKIELNTKMLDKYLTPFFELPPKTRNVAEEILSQLVKLNHFSVSELAEKMSMSNKTLERTIKKHFNFTPKELWNILRFEQTTAHLRSNEVQTFVDALSFGYYDQSHFIKECRRLTGASPKEFFSKMDLPTNDLMVYRSMSRPC